MVFALLAAAAVSLVPGRVLLPAGHRCAAPRLAVAGNEAERSRALFDALIQGHGVTTAVALEGGAREAGGRRLVSAEDVTAGDVLLKVPNEILITAHRSGVVGGLAGQTELMWEEVGDLREEVGEQNFKRGATWDVRLALAVFEALAGSGGDFWLGYRELLPAPPMVTHPLVTAHTHSNSGGMRTCPRDAGYSHSACTEQCLPTELLAALGDEELREKVQMRSKLLQRLAPNLRDHAVHPATAGYAAMGAPMELIPRPLEYAYALVVSRCAPAVAQAMGPTP